MPSIFRHPLPVPGSPLTRGIGRNWLRPVALAGLMLGTAPLLQAGSDAAAEVSAAAQGLYQCLNAGDARGFSRFLLPDGFSEINPEWEGLRQLDLKTFEGIFKSGAKIDLRITDLKVQVLSGTAILTGFRVGTITPPQGQPIASRMPLTMVWRKVDGAWKLVHVHLSQGGPAR